MKDYVSFECSHFMLSDQNDPDEWDSIAYADVDGYPADEDGEGTVICRVWMLKEKHGCYPAYIGCYPAYIVSWSHNGYRMNKEVRRLIEAAKDDLKKFRDESVKQLARTAYERYKLQWMLDNSMTLPDIIKVLAAKAAEGCDEKGLEECFGQIQDEIMFPGGKTWESFGCFEVSEFEDEDYMSRVLTNEQYALWKYRK